MGWKNVKEAYGIGHHVGVTKEGICIGSSFIHDIIVIGQDGSIKKRYDERGNQDLIRYQREMDADPEKLRKLVQSPDKFERSIIVYTYNGAEIIEKLCEEPGWPNVTHDGDFMYDNTYSTDKAKVVQFAKDDVDAGIELLHRRMDELKQELARKENDLLVEMGNREKLDEIVVA